MSIYRQNIERDTKIAYQCQLNILPSNIFPHTYYTPTLVIKNSIYCSNILSGEDPFYSFPQKSWLFYHSSLSKLVNSINCMQMSVVSLTPL